MARGRHYAKLSLSNAARLSFSDLCILLFMFLSLCRLCVCVFLCSHWSLVDVPLIFFCPADHVPDWQPRVLLGMVEARSVNVKKTTTTTTFHIDTAGPYPTTLGGSRYVVMFVDSASHLQRPYGVHKKSAAAIFSVAKLFVSDMRVPRAFCTDNGIEYSNSMFVDFCSGLGIRRELTAPHTPQQNGSVDSAISRAFKAGHAPRLGVPQLYPDIRLDEIRSCTDAAGTSLWLESLL